jgi:hypothetical protein
MLCPGARSSTACRSALALYIRGWLNSININIELQVRAHVAINVAKGPARRRLNSFSISHMNHLERSQEIVPLASIQAMPGSVPTTTQELKRYGEPRQETH